VSAPFEAKTRSEKLLNQKIGLMRRHRTAGTFSKS
jgi:hypothetical protein